VFFIYISHQLEQLPGCCDAFLLTVKSQKGDEIMKRCTFFIMALFLLTSGAFAQIEGGDTEVSFMGFFFTRIGEDIEANGAGSVQLSYGKYITPRLLLGVAPTMTFYTGQDEEGEPKLETDFSGSIFFNFNFSTASKFIPYITGQYYQSTFDIPEDGEFTDYSYINVGLGFKNFFNEYAAFNTMVSYGFSLAEDADWANLVVQTGISFIF
jgi:hypothetical protein